MGTDAYKKYILDYVKAHPDQVSSEMKQVPEVDINDIPKHPK